MEDKVLKIARLPPNLSNERRDALFKKYGAIQTKTIRKSENYTITFAEFSSKEIATNVFIRLNQLEVNGKRLSVEFVNKNINSDVNAENNSKLQCESNSEEKRETCNNDHYRAFVNKLNSWTSGHTFSQPPPPNLCYKYPPPTKNTLIRIAIQLIKNSAFYNQVLHLMNRMNLPPPFIELETEFPVLKQTYDMEQYEYIFGSDINNMTAESNVEEDNEEESEIESDNETVNIQSNVPQKRKLPQSFKRIKIPKFVNPLKQSNLKVNQKVIKPEEIFECVPKETKNVTFKLKEVDKLLNQTNLESVDNSEQEITDKSVGGFGLIFPTNKTDTKEVEKDENTKKQEFISSEQLDENRISANDQKVYPAFKNYHAGIPTNRLYVKNLSKNVEEEDLHFIFKRYITKTTAEHEEKYNIRLMQEGRMKGQAFVTLQNVAQAQLALNETNGYILKDKPMVVQYAKKKS